VRRLAGMVSNLASVSGLMVLPGRKLLPFWVADLRRESLAGVDFFVAAALLFTTGAGLADLHELMQTEALFGEDKAQLLTFGLSAGGVCGSVAMCG
jgi:hypothetical protein